MKKFQEEAAKSMIDTKVLKFIALGIHFLLR